MAKKKQWPPKFHIKFRNTAPPLIPKKKFFTASLRELQQINGDSGVRAELLLGKWAAAQELDADSTLDCKECGKTFADSAKLRRHITTQHNKQKAVTEPPEPE